MRCIRIAILLPVILAAASCATSLENIAEARHQARLEAANADRPLTQGYGDGIGSLVAEAGPVRSRPPQ